MRKHLKSGEQIQSRDEEGFLLPQENIILLPSIQSDVLINNPLLRLTPSRLLNNLPRGATRKRATFIIYNPVQPLPLFSVLQTFSLSLPPLSPDPSSRGGRGQQPAAPLLPLPGAPPPPRLSTSRLRPHLLLSPPCLPYLRRAAAAPRGRRDPTSPSR